MSFDYPANALQHPFEDLAMDIEPAPASSFFNSSELDCSDLDLSYSDIDSPSTDSDGGNDQVSQLSDLHHGIWSPSVDTLDDHSPQDLAHLAWHAPDLSFATPLGDAQSPQTQHIAALSSISCAPLSPPSPPSPRHHLRPYYVVQNPSPGSSQQQQQYWQYDSEDETGAYCSPWDVCPRLSAMASSDDQSSPSLVHPPFVRPTYPLYPHSPSAVSEYLDASIDLVLDTDTDHVSVHTLAPDDGLCAPSPHPSLCDQPPYAAFGYHNIPPSPAISFISMPGDDDYELGRAPTPYHDEDAFMGGSDPASSSSPLSSPPHDPEGESELESDGEYVAPTPRPRPRPAPAPAAAPRLTPPANPNPNGRRTFKTGLWEAINDPSFTHLIRWADDGTHGIIPDKKKFETSSAMKVVTDARDIGGFVRQLHMWGFSRSKAAGEGHNSCAFSHEMFLRGRPDLLEQVVRSEEKKAGKKTTTKKKSKKEHKTGATKKKPKTPSPPARGSPKARPPPARPPTRPPPRRRTSKPSTLSSPTNTEVTPPRSPSPGACRTRASLRDTIILQKEIASLKTDNDQMDRKHSALLSKLAGPNTLVENCL